MDGVVNGSGFLLRGEEPRRVQYFAHFGVAADEYVGMTLNRAHGGIFAHAGGSRLGALRGERWDSGRSGFAGGGSVVNVLDFLLIIRKRPPSR